MSKLYGKNVAKSMIVGSDNETKIYMFIRDSLKEHYNRFVDIGRTMPALGFWGGDGFIDRQANKIRETFV